MFISDPDFSPSRIPDLGSHIRDPTQHKGGREKSVGLSFFSQKFDEIVNILFLNREEKI
jgi:hypothetical protein